jgi:uncharacterized RDD family membrane protein YckC
VEKDLKAVGDFTAKRTQALAQLGSTTPAVPGFVSRGIALVIDVFVMALACIFTTLILAWTGTFLRMGTVSGGPRLVDVGSRAAIILVCVFYLPLSWAFTGQSVGKAILGLRVVRRGAESSTERLALWRCFVRGTGYWLSAIPFGFGFLLAAFDKEHRTLHDRLAGTRVIYQPPKRRSAPKIVSAP